MTPTPSKLHLSGAVLTVAVLAAMMGRVIAVGGEKNLAPSTSEFVGEAVAEKTLLSTVMMGTVWPGGWTEVRWYLNGRVYRAISNIDYSRLPQMIEWEDGQSRYQLTIFATKMDAETTAELLAHGRLNQDGLPVSWPARVLLPIPGGAPESVIGWDSMAEETEESLAAAAAVLDAFHDYYASHSGELLDAWQQRETQRPALEAAARAAQIANQRKPRGVRFLGAWRAPKLDNSPEGNR